MARTYRDKNHTAAARAEREALWDSLPPGAFPDQFEGRRPRSRFHGGDMIMAPRNGTWGDERYQQSAARRTQRRTLKRRERQAWKAAL